MYRAFGFSFADVKGLVLFLVMLVVFVFAYHKVIQSSIRSHPESTRRAVQEHCRYMLGKQLGKIPQEDLSEKLRKCDDVRIKSVSAGGGVFDPVIVRITLDGQSQSPLGKDIYIFKTAAINTGKFNFLSGLNSLSSGHWEFNFYNTYSDTYFYGSF